MVKAVALAVLAVVAACAGSPAAAADPEILEPYCTSGQVPTTDACKPAPDEVYVNNAPGADPDVPLGLDPETVPDV